MWVGGGGCWKKLALVLKGRMLLIEQTLEGVENSEEAQLFYCILYENLHSCVGLPLVWWHDGHSDGDGDGGDGYLMMMRPFFSLASLHTHSLSLPSPCTTLPEIKSYMYIGHRLLKLFYSNKLISKGKRGFYHFSWHDDPGSGRQENVFRLFLERNEVI